MNSAAVAARGFTVPYSDFPLTSTLAQALRPFPQYASGLAATWAPLGDTWYNSLQVKATKRLSHGLDFTYAFTWQKSLNNLGADGSPANDVFNRPVNKVPFPVRSASGQRLRRHVHGSEMGEQGLLVEQGAVLRDERLAARRYLHLRAAACRFRRPRRQNNLSAALFQNTFSNRVPGVPLFTQDLNCHCFDPNKTFVLNPAAWTDPARGHVRHGGGVLQRLPAAAPAGGVPELRPTVPHHGRKPACRFGLSSPISSIAPRLASPTSTNALATQTTECGRPDHCRLRLHQPGYRRCTGADRPVGSAIPVLTG